MTPAEITSPQNKLIKQIEALRTKKSLRFATQTFVVEGYREIYRALHCGYHARQILVCEELTTKPKLNALKQLIAEDSALITCSRTAYNRISIRQDAEGLLAVVQMKSEDKESILRNKVPLLIIVEQVEKPGNLGALLRTADAVKADGVFITGAAVDRFNPNVIRASLGGVFSVPCFNLTNEDALAFCQRHGLTVFVTRPGENTGYFHADLTGPCALVFGSESQGLSNFWDAPEFRKISLPMLGLVDSLNLSVTSAVLMYEALRQRN